jgi:hypothetical protein
MKRAYSDLNEAEQRVVQRAWLRACLGMAQMFSAVLSLGFLFAKGVCASTLIAFAGTTVLTVASRIIFARERKAGK